jgi:hypothetical protein
MESAEYRVYKLKYRVYSTEYRICNMEYRIQNRYAESQVKRHTKAGLRLFIPSFVFLCAPSWSKFSFPVVYLIVHSTSTEYRVGNLKYRVQGRIEPEGSRVLFAWSW